MTRAASLLCVFTSIVSQAFLRRVPCPRSRLLFFTLPAREICFVRPSVVAHTLKTPILYQKIRPATEISRRDFPAAGLSGLSLPDAPCEHTSIRPSAANLTSGI